MTTETTTPTLLDLDELRTRVRGRVIGPRDAEYDRARTVVYGGFDGRPAAIVRVADTRDVQAVVAVARETGLELAVRSGGHSGAGHGTTIGGLVLDLRDLKALDIDAAARTAWAETGLTAIEVVAAAAEHGLTVGFGDTGSVGIGGITVGGGVGFLVRKHGLTIDSVLAADVVTADGELRRVDATSDPDLFWAIRGGGGNFGVVTRFQYRLHELPSIVGGLLVLPATADVIAGFMSAADAAPEELSVIANVMPCPPMPFLAPDVHGSLVILALMAFAGPDADGERAMAPFRALAEPLADMVRPMAYAQMFEPEDEEYHPTAVARTMFIERVDRDDAQTMVDHLNASDASVRVVQLRVLGGAMARVPSDATAFAHRNGRIMVNVAAFYDGAADKPVREAWVAELSAALHQGNVSAYVNFLADDGPARIRAAYPGRTWDRLTEIKRRYDPTNLFRRNHNIPPAEA